MTTFDEAVEREFPGAVRSEVFLARAILRLDPLGFSRETTMPAVSVCRDERAQHLVTQIEAIWGPAFTLAGLGGLPMLGRTGWGAALSHIHEDKGRGRLLAFGFAHIGVSDDGVLGVTERPGLSTPTPACGALSTILTAARSRSLPADADVDDYEASALAVRLIDRDHPPIDMVELTRMALAAIEADLWSALDGFEVWRDHDVVVWCGVQIHGRDGDWIWALEPASCGADGVHRTIPA